jgi:hypothetical protein
MTPASHTRRWALVLVLLQALPGFAEGPLAAKILKRLMAPFRASPFLLNTSRPCGLGSNCFMPSEGSGSGEPAPSPFEQSTPTEDPLRPVQMELREYRGGPIWHHWLELTTSHGRVTIGFGPATLPFIDSGQISLQDSYGNIERLSGMHPVPVMGLPPINYSYAKPPGAGHSIGKPISLTLEQADALVQKERHHKYVGPYIPIFHDCRTYVCGVQASARGKSRLPCYLLFKGYW